jgi:hypothetical protein
VGEVVADQNPSRTWRVRATAVVAEVDLHLAMTGRGFSDEVEVASASTRIEVTWAKASSHRGTKSTEVVCSRRRQIVETSLLESEASSAVDRKDEKCSVTLARMVGSNLVRKARSR